MIPVYSLLLVCVLPIPSAHEAAGATGIRHSPRPLLGERFINGSGALRGEAANARLDVIASQRVARMRAPLARNDGSPGGATPVIGRVRATRWLAMWLTASRLTPAGAHAGFMILGRYAGMTGISRDRSVRIIEPATVLPIC